MRIGNLFSCCASEESLEPSDNDGAKNPKEFEIQEEPSEKGSQWLQFAAAISASISLMACGGYLGWTSPSLPYLTSDASEFAVTSAQSAWITSLYTIGGALGSLLCPVIIDRLGRKCSLLAFAIPQLAGWGLIIAAKSYVILYVARFVAGMAHGGIHSVAVIYYAEIADKNIRGAFGTFLKMSANLGSLFVTTAGAYLDYRTLNLVSLTLPLAFASTFVFMPETPYFYLVQGREDRATRCLMKLRSLKNPESVRRDIEAMKESVLEGQRSKRGAIRQLVSTRGNRLGLWILLSLKVTQQFSGHMAIVAYTQEIFSHSGSSLKPQEAVIVLGAAQLGAGLVAAGLVDRLGRRILILLSGLVAALALGLVGLFFFMKYQLLADVSSITWLPIAALIIYEIMMALGIGTIPYVILGEIFPTNVKGMAVAFGIVVGSVFASLVGLGFKALNNLGGIHVTFWTFTVCCTLGTLVTFFITPETKGKTLEEIQDIMNRRKKDVEQ